VNTRARKSETADSTISAEQVLPLSGAVSMLVKGMFAGLHQPKPLHKIKLDYQKAPVIFGPWREQAHQRVRRAAVTGQLPVYVKPLSGPGLIIIPPDVIGRLITVRGGLPDRPVRPTMKVAGGDGQLLGMLQTGTLVVCGKEFASWYRKERRKGQWPSQRSKKEKRGSGRPTKMTTALRREVADVLRERGHASVAELRRILAASGRRDVPSVDTLERLVDQLHRETGEPHFFRAKRRRRQRT
jgi:hypothetical protein